MKKIFAILIALSALSNFSCKEKEEEYTEGGLVFGGIYMLDGQQLVETDGYILELPAEQNTVELRIVSKGVQEFGIGGYPMSGLGEYKVEGFTIKVTPDPASEKLEIYDYIDVEYKGEQHRVPRQCEGHPFADAPCDARLDAVGRIGPEAEVTAADRAAVAGAALPVEVGQREGHGAEGIGQREVHFFVGGGGEVHRSPGRCREVPA